MNIRDFVPPVIAKYYRNKIRKLKIFRSYREAFSAIPLTYAQDDFVNVVAQKTKHFLNNLKNQKPLIAIPEFIQGLFAVSIAAGKKNRAETVNVIDFGGAFGTNYFLSELFFREAIEFKWHVVELPAVVEKGKKEFENKNLKFFDNLSAAVRDLDKVDLMFSAATLMYCPNPYRVTKELLDCEADFLYLGRLRLTNEVKEIITVEQSLLSYHGPCGQFPRAVKDKPKRNVITLMNKQKFESLIREKYDILLVFGNVEEMIGSRSVVTTGYLAKKYE